MSKKYIKRRKWTPEDMERALAAINDKKMGYLKASATFGVPRITLFRLAQKINMDISQLVRILLGRKPIFSNEMEMQLVNYIKEMEDKFFGLTPNDVRQLAFQLATKNGITNNFSVLYEKAGTDWLRLFLKRNSKFCLCINQRVRHLQG